LHRSRSAESGNAAAFEERFMSVIAEPGYRIDTAPAIGSAVSWGAILAGAAAAAVMSLVLMILGTGLGLAVASPWNFDSGAATAFGVSTIIWLTVQQLIAAGVGGYLAGRLRTKWAGIVRDEVFFRDTAHGFLSWAIASLAMAAMLTSAIGAIVSGGVQAGASLAGGVAAAGAASGAVVASSDDRNGAQSGRGQAQGQGGAAAALNPMGYLVDSLFRSDNSTGTPVVPQDGAAGPAPGQNVQSPEQTATYIAEVTRIYAHGMRTGMLPDEDVAYVGRMVAQRTGIPQSQAEQRVRDKFSQLQMTARDAENAAKSAADAARKASAYAALWLVVSLLAGAFVASFMATYGGRQRDL
jgi:hypothetical protein